MTTGALVRAVFFDRDGVLNEAVVRNGRPFPPANAGELVLDRDASWATAALQQAGYRLIVVTNQPDVGRGMQTVRAVEAIHEELCRRLPLDDVVACYHGRDGECACRKPLPGMLHDAAARHGIDLSASFLIGDRWRDIDAGAAAGVRTILIARGYDERGPDRPPEATVPSLRAAAEWILAQPAGTPAAPNAALPRGSRS